MKILDRYIIKHFLIPMLFCTGVLIFLVLIADVFDNLDEFLRNDVTLREALRYYLNLIPYVFVQVVQWGSFLGIMHCLVSFNTNNELTAMKVAGLEIMTIVRPLIYVGFLIGIISFLVSDQLVPPTYKISNRIREEKIERKKTKQERTTFNDLTYYGGKNRLYYAGSLDISTNKMTDLIVLWIDSAKRTRKKVMAREADWNGSVWELKMVNELDISPSGQVIGQPKNFESAIYPEINETPQEFYRSVEESMAIPYKDLKDHLRKLKENGLRPNSELVDLNMRLSAPWYSLIMMLIAIPFLGKTATRKTIALNILYALGIVFAFHVSQAVSVALGKAGRLFPFFSVWLNNFAFGFGALFFMERANR